MSEVQPTEQGGDHDGDEGDSDGEEKQIPQGLPERWACLERGPVVFDLRDHGWLALMPRYAGMGPAPVLNCVFETVAKECPTHARLESGYIDEDFRDEYANFYAKTYRELPSRCERLHFFDEPNDAYLGYVILRPIIGRPVSRTMLAPPAELRPHVSCTARGTATPWGVKLEVQGFPFISQDAQFGSCAHAAIWMVALYFHRRFRAPRYHLSDLADSASRHQDVLPAQPSGGLTGRQISAVLHDLNMTPVIYRIDESLPDRAESIACRYLNSGLPVILLNETERLGHSKVLVGYGRDEKGLFFVHHDDQKGPYRTTRNLLIGGDDEGGEEPAGDGGPAEQPQAQTADHPPPTPSAVAQGGEPRALDTPEATAASRHGNDRLVIPMPGRIYLSGEAAERWAAVIFKQLIEEQLKEGNEQLEPLLDGLREGGPLRLRCYATESSEYMVALRARQPVSEVVNWHVGIPVSHWLWIVELQSRAAAAESTKCVLGEVAIDATSDEQWVNPLFGNLPGVVFFWPSLGDDIDVAASGQDLTPYATGCALHVG
jgi:hypothetical protein